jgi:hypothetical protein
VIRLRHSSLLAFGVLCLSFLVTLRFPHFSQAITVTHDPQFVVMNFSTIIELNWAAPEEEWQQQIKPQIHKELDAMLAELPRGTEHRQLAWSTLMEYMNHPLDEAGANSIYAIKTRRIFEIAEEKDLPVFIPLNGFQWWDELPELYNWWDPDGTKTAPQFFARQDNPEEFKRRFIAGYNPENKWNVEWQDWSTPMQLNWRNWGGGGFRLAPPPNLVYAHSSKQLTYRSVLQKRLEVILSEVVHSVEALEKKGKGHLFVGISLGTEISLNASATPQDEFMPYGYRAIQDTLCPDRTEVCLNSATTSANLMELRSQIVGDYLRDLSRLAVHKGLPKQRIYTHVWGEADESDPKYAPYAIAAVNLYSRPGISLYGFAEKPYDSKSWSHALSKASFSNWGAVEYSVPKDAAIAQNALANTLNSSNPRTLPAKVIVMYNWGEHKNTPAIPALRSALSVEPAPLKCDVPEVISQTAMGTENPAELTWTFLPTSATSEEVSHLSLAIVKGFDVKNGTPQEIIQELPVGSTSVTLPELPAGVYSWYVINEGCESTLQRSSEPRTFQILHQSTQKVPFWVEKLLPWLER